MDKTQWDDFKIFFTLGCKTMGLKTPIYENRGDTSSSNWLYFVHTHFGVIEKVTYQDLLVDFVPPSLHDRFQPPIPVSCCRPWWYGILPIISLIIIISVVFLRHSK
jgi:hypothetical protein